MKVFGMSDTKKVSTPLITSNWFQAISKMIKNLKNYYDLN